MIDLLKGIVFLPYCNNVQIHRLTMNVQMLLMTKIFVESSHSLGELYSTMRNDRLSFQQLVIHSANIANTALTSGIQISAIYYSGDITRGLIINSLLTALPPTQYNLGTTLSATGDTLCAFNYKMLGYTLKATHLIGSKLQSIKNAVGRLFQKTDDKIPEALYYSAFFQSVTCEITKKPIRYIVVANHSFYEKNAAKALNAKPHYLLQQTIDAELNKFQKTLELVISLPQQTPQVNLDMIDKIPEHYQHDAILQRFICTISKKPIRYVHIPKDSDFSTNTILYEKEAAPPDAIADPYIQRVIDARLKSLLASEVHIDLNEINVPLLT